MRSWWWSVVLKAGVLLRNSSEAFSVSPQPSPASEILPPYILVGAGHVHSGNKGSRWCSCAAPVKNEGLAGFSSPLTDSALTGRGKASGSPRHSLQPSTSHPSFKTQLKSHLQKDSPLILGSGTPLSVLCPRILLLGICNATTSQNEMCLQ